MSKKTKGAKKVKGRMKVLLSMLYKNNRIYIRMIDKDLFIWDAIYKGELYSSYIVVSPEKGRKTLTKGQIETARNICYAGVTTTIDIKMGVKLDKKTKENVKMFEKSRKKVESLLK